MVTTMDRFCASTPGTSSSGRFLSGTRPDVVCLRAPGVLGCPCRVAAAGPPADRCRTGAGRNGPGGRGDRAVGRPSLSPPPFLSGPSSRSARIGPQHAALLFSPVHSSLSATGSRRRPRRMAAAPGAFQARAPGGLDGAAPRTARPRGRARGRGSPEGGGNGRHLRAAGVPRPSAWPPGSSLPGSASALGRWRSAPASLNVATPLARWLSERSFAVYLFHPVVLIAVHDLRSAGWTPIRSSRFRS
jgi:hypothetical protein